MATVVCTPQCPALPSEIWAQIFTFLDEVDLWITCRQVSQALRVEAEREIASNRLKNMIIQAHADGCFSVSGTKHDFSVDTVTAGFAGLSANGSRATYTLDIDPEISMTVPDNTRRYIEDWMCRQAFLNPDVQFHNRLGYFDPMTTRRRITMQVVRICGTRSEAPITALDIDTENNRISFE